MLKLNHEREKFQKFQMGLGWISERFLLDYGGEIELFNSDILVPISYTHQHQHM